MADINNVIADEIDSMIANRIKEAESFRLPDFAEELYSKMRQWVYAADRHGKDWVGTQYIMSVLSKKDNCEIEVITRDNNSFSVREDDKKIEEEKWEFNNEICITISKLSIVYNGKIVFTTNRKQTTVCSDYDIRSYESTTGVLLYIPGEWLNVLKKICLDIKTAENKRSKLIDKANRENPERIAALKNKWEL